MGQFTAPTRTFLLCALTLVAGVAADAAGHVWIFSGLWAELLPRAYYVGIVLTAIRFGQSGGLIAGSLAGICHAVLMSFGHTQPISAIEELAAFVLVGLLVGFVTKSSESRKDDGTEAKQPEPTGIGQPISARRSNDKFSSMQITPDLVHQLRTPLASIGGAGFVLEDETLSPEKRQEFVAIILRECQRLDHLVGLLDFTSPESGYHNEDVSTILDEVIRLAGSRADSRKHPLRKEAAPGLPKLVCDRELIRQAVVDLTVNAMLATPAGREIVLAAHSSNDQVFIDVVDQRLGAGEESLDSIFDRSSSNEHWRTHLATARQVAMQHGGAITVRRHNRGITTSMVLPAPVNPNGTRSGM
jgi:signal transduction histidine kinase